MSSATVVTSISSFLPWRNGTQYSTCAFNWIFIYQHANSVAKEATKASFISTLKYTHLSKATPSRLASWFAFRFVILFFILLFKSPLSAVSLSLSFISNIYFPIKLSGCTCQSNKISLNVRTCYVLFFFYFLPKIFSRPSYYIVNAS